MELEKAQLLLKQNAEEISRLNAERAEMLKGEESHIAAMDKELKELRTRVQTLETERVDFLKIKGSLA